MSSETIQPSPGVPNPSSDDSPADLTAPSSSSSSDLGPNPAKPHPVAPGSSSSGDEGEPASVDDLGLALKQIKPDPFLGEFEPKPVHTSIPRSTPGLGADSLESLDLDVPPSAEEPAIVDPSSGVSVDLSKLNLDAGASGAPVPTGATGRSQAGPAPAPFVPIDLGAPPASHDAGRESGEGGAEAEDEDVEDDDEELPPRRVSLPVALLASYASAVTIGLIWVLWGHRAPREGGAVDELPPAGRSAAADRGAELGRKPEPPKPIAPDRFVSLGQTLELGSLEVTPLEIDAGPVILRRDVALSQVRLGGEDALSLRLRLKNVSSGSVLFPLDEGFLRERGRGIRDSYIETGAGRRIDMFPLAIESEWSIVDQEFRELQPGESYEALIYTAPDALAQLAPEMTWRIRLRTDVNQTEDVGVRFRGTDIRRTSGEAVNGQAMRLFRRGRNSLRPPGKRRNGE